jgi:hypothetical protein
MAGLAGLTAAVPPSESGTITAPTLIIWGERDELLPLQGGHLLAASHPRLPACCVSGHGPPRAVGAAPTSGHGPGRLRRQAFNIGSEQHAHLIGVRPQPAQRDDHYARITSASADHGRLVRRTASGERAVARKCHTWRPRVVSLGADHLRADGSCSPLRHDLDDLRALRESGCAPPDEVRSQVQCLFCPADPGRYAL